ncbi:hypothetical protein H4582DRAFT_2058648 [Lactarius indigo]|nr:hypothetical protein H4582DRAFT_2058648 [Lactarius indigo]
MIPTSSASSPRVTFTTAAAVPPAVNNCVESNSGNLIQGHQVALKCAMAAVLGLVRKTSLSRRHRALYAEVTTVVTRWLRHISMPHWGALGGRRQVQHGLDSPTLMGMSKFKGSSAGNSGAQKDQEYFEPVVLNDGAGWLHRLRPHKNLNT